MRKAWSYIASKWKYIWSMKRFEHGVSLLSLSCAIYALYISAHSVNALKKQIRLSTETETQADMPMVFPAAPTFSIEDHDGVPSVKIHQEFANFADYRAVGIIFEWGRAKHPPGGEADDFQSKNRGWQHDTWVKGYPARDDIYLPLTDAKATAATHSKLYIYAKIRYRDVFSVDDELGHPRQDHLVEWCLQSKPKKFTVSDTQINYEGEPCEVWNCVDDECPDKDYKDYIYDKQNPAW